MPIFRPLNEFGREPVVMALELGRECRASCTYCFATLNSRHQKAGDAKNQKDRSTFEFAVRDAHSANYDPSHFPQFYIKSRFAISMSNTVEATALPDQFNATMTTLRKLQIPVFLQMKGVNFNECFDSIAAHAQNVAAYISIPSLDERVQKRFEPGTPPLRERLDYLSRLKEAGCYTIAAISPYHKSFSSDPTALASTLISCGADQLFIDHLHLNQRQRKVITDHGGDKMLLTMLQNQWDKETLEHMIAFYDTCFHANIPIFNNSYKATIHGLYNTAYSVCPQWFMRSGHGWPYNDSYFLRPCEELYLQSPSPIAITWSEACASMEAQNTLPELSYQKFTYTIMHDYLSVANLTPLWQNYLRPAATIRQYYRAFWNSPSMNSFGWRHPFVRVAMRDEHTPWLDEEGDAIMIYDPTCPLKELRRIIPESDMNEFQYFTFEP